MKLICLAILGIIALISLAVLVCGLLPSLIRVYFKHDE